MVLVSKKDGTKRFCCDYTKTNGKIVRDNFAMALIGEVLEKKQSAKVFITLDLTNGIFHVPIEPNSRIYKSNIIFSTTH